MQASQVGELYFISPIKNVPSILEQGILCHDRVAKVAHVSIASDEIQSIRDGVRIRGGGMLHSYANLFFCQRNPMMFKVLRDFEVPHQTLAVLCIDPTVLQLPNVVITDGYAYSEWSRPGTWPTALDNIDYDTVHARYWTNHADWRDKMKHRSQKSAEVLVPDRVSPEFIVGAHASCEESAMGMRAIMGELNVQVVPYVFFL